MRKIKTDTSLPNEVQVPHLEVDTVGGEVFFHKEKEILTRLERLETKIKAWTEGMTDLNGRMKAVKEYVEGVNGILDKQKDLEFALGQSFAGVTNKVDKLNNNVAFLLDDNKDMWTKLAALQVDVSWLKNQAEGANMADMAMSRDIQEMKKAQDFLRDENRDRSDEQSAQSVDLQQMEKNGLDQRAEFKKAEDAIFKVMARVAMLEKGADAAVLDAAFNGPRPVNPTDFEEEEK